MRRQHAAAPGPIEAEFHPGLDAADQFGHRLARARAVRPAQRAVPGIDPQPAYFGFADVGNVGGRGGAQAGPELRRAALLLQPGVADAGLSSLKVAL